MADVRTFGTLLQSLEDGQLINDLSDKVRELNVKLIRQAEAQGAATGELTLKLKFKCDQGGSVQIDGTIAMKDPKPGRQRSVLWLTMDGNMTESNPKQTKLPLREVDRPKTAKDPGAEERPVRNV